MLLYFGLQVVAFRAYCTDKILDIGQPTAASHPEVWFDMKYKGDALGMPPLWFCLVMKWYYCLLKFYKYIHLVAEPCSWWKKGKSPQE